MNENFYAYYENNVNSSAGCFCLRDKSTAKHLASSLSAVYSVYSVYSSFNNLSCVTNPKKRRNLAVSPLTLYFMIR